MFEHPDDNFTERFTAHEIEQAVLGSYFSDEEYGLYMLTTLSEEVFFGTTHRQVFDLIKHFHKKTASHDPVAFSDYMVRAGIKKEDADVILNNLIGSASIGPHIETHCQILLEKYMHRNLYRMLMQLVRKATDASTDVYELIDFVTGALKTFSEEKVFHSLPDINKQILDLYSFIAESQVDASGFSVKTGLPIDTRTGGVYNSDLLIIAARPSMGKTALMLTIVLNLLEAKFERPIVVFSYEMNARMLLLRIICMKARVPMEAVRRGSATTVDIQSVFEAGKSLGFEVILKEGKITFKKTEDCNLFIFDNQNITPSRQSSLLYQVKAQHGSVGIVICDYLQLMPVEKDNSLNIRNREQEISYISRSLKGIAKQFDIPYIALSQLSRGVENRPTKRPVLSDLRESGAIEQDADTVFLLYRPEYYGIKELPDGGSSDGVAEIIIAKQRNGSVGEMYMTFEKRFALFSGRDNLLEKARGKNTGSYNNDSSYVPPVYDDNDIPF